LTTFKYIVFFIAFLFLVFPIQAGSFVLVIDPGHGGKDTGALGRKGKEKDINLAVATLVGRYIASEHPDVKIVYTRNKDVFIGLDERADIANKANANLFISIHANAVSKKSHIRGAEVYTFGVTRIQENLDVAKRENSVILLEDNYEQKYEGFDPNSAESYIIFEFMVNLYAEQSINFAGMVQKELVKTAKRGDRGVKQAGYLVLRKSSMPRILIELDFISNPEAENFMLSAAGQKSMARAISNAFAEYKKEFNRKSSILPVKENSTIALQETHSSTENKTNPEDTVRIQNESVEKPATTKEKETFPPNRIYKIQILASTKKLPDKSPELKGYKADFYREGKYYKYTYGESSDWKEITNLQKKIAKDFKSAFIITFENGIKIANK
jgi:N-acetylmuramoyl-L-alanine amidase